MKFKLIAPLCCAALLLGACESKTSEAPEAKAPEVAGSAPVENEARPGSFLLASLEHEVVSGKPSQISFEVKPGKDLKINPEYPWKFTLDAPQNEALTVGQELVMKKGGMEIDAKRAVIPVSLTASAEGTYELQGSLNLSVCEKGDEARCLWFTDEPVTLKVEAKSAPAP